MNKHQRDEILAVADTLRKANEAYENMVVPDYSVKLKTQWEYYYSIDSSKWIVCGVDQNDMCVALGIAKEEEAKFICDKFNELEELR